MRLRMLVPTPAHPQEEYEVHSLEDLYAIPQIESWRRQPSFKMVCAVHGRDHVYLMIETQETGRLSVAIIESTDIPDWLPER